MSADEYMDPLQLAVDITPEFLSKNAHIPTAEILQDIADTEAEIAQMSREIPAHEILAQGGDRLHDMRARAKRDGVDSRRRFIFQLQALLKARGF